MSGKQGYRWPIGMWDRAKALLESGMTQQQVGLELKIPLATIKHKAKWEGMSDEQKRRRLERARVNAGYYRREMRPRRSYNPIDAPPRLQFERTAARPDEKLIAERDYRLSLQPRDLTALLCGDPPPGYSALERRA